MPIFTRPAVKLPEEQLQGLSTWEEAAGASFGETWNTGPVASLATAIELSRTENYAWGERGQDFLGGGARRALSPKLSAESAAQQVADAGLTGHVPLDKYPQGLRQDTLNLLIQKNRDKVRRQTIASQYQGWTPQVAGMVMGSIVDPGNIALSLIPVVGEARYAALLKRAGGAFGRAGVRAGVGATEGLVGATLAEPFIYYGQQQWRNDYDAYDSALNIAGGALFGAALHAGAGMVLDGFKKVPALKPEAAPPETVPPVRSDAVVSTDSPAPYAIDHLAADRERALVMERLAEGRPLTREQAMVQASAALRNDIAADLTARGSGVAESNVVAAAKTERAAVTKELAGLEASRRALVKAINERPSVTRKQAETMADAQLAERKLDMESRLSRADNLIAGNKDASAAAAEMSAFEKSGQVPETWRARVTEEADRLLGSTGELPLSAAIRDTLATDTFAGVRPFVAMLDQSTQAASLRMALAQAGQGQRIDVTPAMLSDPMFRENPEAYVAAHLAATRGAAEVEGADPVAARLAEQRVKEAPASQTLEDARQLLADDEQRLRDRGGDPTQIEADDVEARQQADAAKAFSLCMMRHTG